jgi:hypothetical protein
MARLDKMMAVSMKRGFVPSLKYDPSVEPTMIGLLRFHVDLISINQNQDEAIV